MTSRSPGWPALTARQRLGARLRGLRELAGLRNEDIAAALKVSPATVSRIESGDRLIKLPEVDVWVTVTRADEETAVELRTALRAAVNQVSPWGEREATGKDRPQIETAKLEESATKVYGYDHAVVHGLLQTREYAYRVFRLADVTDGQGLSEKVDARMRRQAVLLDQSREFTILMSEAALRWRPSSAELQRDQLRRIRATMHLPNVRIGILPLNVQVDVIYPEGFQIYLREQGDGDPIVVVELVTDEVTLGDPMSVDLYLREFKRLSEVAWYDADALAVLDRIEADAQA